MMSAQSITHEHYLYPTTRVVTTLIGCAIIAIVPVVFAKRDDILYYALQIVYAIINMIWVALIWWATCIDF